MKEAPLFVERVRRMRHWQQQYFATRDGNDLTRAKQAERLVDRDLERFDSQANGQATLFQDPEGPAWVKCSGCSDWKVPAWIGLCRRCRADGLRIQDNPQRV